MSRNPIKVSRCIITIEKRGRYDNSKRIPCHLVFTYHTNSLKLHIRTEHMLPIVFEKCCIHARVRINILVLIFQLLFVKHGQPSTHEEWQPYNPSSTERIKCGWRAVVNICWVQRISFQWWFATILYVDRFPLFLLPYNILFIYFIIIVSRVCCKTLFSSLVVECPLAAALHTATFK